MKLCKNDFSNKLLWSFFFFFSSPRIFLIYITLEVVKSNYLDCSFVLNIVEDQVKDFCFTFSPDQSYPRWTAHYTALHTHSEFQSFTLPCELRTDQPATRWRKSSRTHHYLVLMTVTICTNNTEEAAASGINCWLQPLKRLQFAW